MEGIRLVLCTFPDIEQARQIGTAVVERQLAACVNLVPGVESIYRWEGAVERAAEVLGIFKTTREACGALQAALAELHPYEVPELVVVEPSEVAEAYRRWVCGEVRI
jgi:periplasmic divalent cation tolerance protein